MSDIAKSILGGGWALVVGWILPTAINIIVFGIFVFPSLHEIALAGELSRASVGQRSLVVLASSVVLGLVLSALQVPLYRVLEGYLLWPQWLARWSRDRRLSAKRLLVARRDWIRLRTLEEKGSLARQVDRERLQELSADPKVQRFAKRDEARTAVQRAVLTIFNSGGYGVWSGGALRGIPEV
jgi:hypothetical protein